MQSRQYLVLLSFICFIGSTTAYGWGWSNITHDISQAASSVTNVVKNLNDKMTDQLLSYTQISSYPLGIQDMTISIQYATGSPQQINLIQDGAFTALANGMNYGTLFQNLDSVASTGFFSTKTTTSHLIFHLNIENGLLNINSSQRTRVSDTSNNSIPRPTIKSLGSINTSLTSQAQPQNYQVIINGKNASNGNTPMNRACYIDLTHMTFL